MRPTDLAEADPAGLVTRLENRLTRLEAAKANAVAAIDHARSEIDHATASLGRPFPQAVELTAARDRSRQIDEQLEAAASTPLRQDPEAATSRSTDSEANHQPTPHNDISAEGDSSRYQPGVAPSDFHDPAERHYPTYGKDHHAHEREAGQ